MSKPKVSKFQSILKEMNIDETFTKADTNNTKSFNTIRDNVPLIPNYNMMADLLMLPTAKFGFKYLFVIVDLASKAFDIEPMKSKTPEACLKAMEKCFTREYVSLPYSSLKTDGGSEFKSVFHKYLYDKSILHKVAMPDRHQQMSMVESLNRQLGRLFNGFMNAKEIETGKEFKNWTMVVPDVREKLNEFRKTKLPKDPNAHEYPLFDPFKESTIVKLVDKKEVKTKVYKEIVPKFAVGDMVHRKLDAPRNALGVKQSGKFRAGDFRYDTVARKIIEVFNMSGKGPLYRYYLEGLPNVSYPEHELKKV